MLLPNEIAQLSAAEKIFLAERFWEEIETSDTTIPFSSEQEQKINRHRYLYKTGNTSFHSWE